MLETPNRGADMPIPDYGLWNRDHTQQILSRDRRFNHSWYVSKKLDYFDNFTADDVGWPTLGNAPGQLGATTTFGACPVLYG